MNGTQLAIDYGDNTLVVWNYSKCEILFEKNHPRYTNIEWNPTRPNILATFHRVSRSVNFHMNVNKCGSIFDVENSSIF